MELKHLKTFTVVAGVHGFTKAAEVLGYVQSSVTTQIRALEEELGGALFDRLGKKVVLTDMGRRLLPYAQEMLKLQASVKELIQADDTPSGTLTIGAPESLAAYRLPAVIRAYKRLYPRVKIILKPGSCWELRHQVRNGEVDIAFLLEPEVVSPDLQIQTLVEEQMALIAPPDHPLIEKRQVEAHDLEHETLLHTEPGCSYRGLFEQYLQGHGVTPSVTMEFWNIEAIKNCVMSGLGISLVPLVTVQSELEDGKIAALHWDDSVARVSTQIVVHKAKWMTPALREFLRLVHEHALAWNRDGIGGT